MTESKGRSPIDPQLRGRLIAFVKLKGEKAAVTHLGISRNTLARALANLPCRPGSAALIAIRLEMPVQP